MRRRRGTVLPCSQRKEEDSWEGRARGAPSIGSPSRNEGNSKKTANCQTREPERGSNKMDRGRNKGARLHRWTERLSPTIATLSGQAKPNNCIQLNWGSFRLVPAQPYQRGQRGEDLLFFWKWAVSRCKRGLGKTADKGISTGRLNCPNDTTGQGTPFR